MSKKLILSLRLDETKNNKKENAHANLWVVLNKLA